MSVAGKDSRTQLSPGGDVTHMELSFPLSPHLHGCLNSLSLCPVCKKAKQQEVGDLIRSNIWFYMHVCFINWIGSLLPFTLEENHIFNLIKSVGRNCEDTVVHRYSSLLEITRPFFLFPIKYISTKGRDTSSRRSTCVKPECLLA